MGGPRSMGHWTLQGSGLYWPRIIRFLFTERLVSATAGGSSYLVIFTMLGTSKAWCLRYVVWIRHRWICVDATFTKSIFHHYICQSFVFIRRGKSTIEHFSIKRCWTWDCKVWRHRGIRYKLRKPRIFESVLSNACGRWLNRKLRLRSVDSLWQWWIR